MDTMVSQDFLDIPDRVYQDDPNYIPVPKKQVAWQFSGQNPLVSQTKIWWQCAPDQARLAGFFDPAQLIEGQPAAFFGFWESIDEPYVNKQLFHEFEAWARELGANRVYGPIDFTTYGRYRLRLGQPKFPAPVTGEPYNPNYYPRLLHGLGYSVSEKYGSLVLKPRLLSTVLSKLKSMGHPPPDYIQFLDLDPETLLRHRHGIYQLVDQIFSKNFAYRKVSKAQFEEHILPSYQRILDPRSSVLLMDQRQQRVVGLALCHPDYSQLTRQGLPQPLAPEQVSFEEHRHLLKNPFVLGKTFGLLPEYRRLGLHSAMIHRSIRRAYGWGRPIAFLARQGGHSLQPVTAPADLIEYGLFTKYL